MNSEHTTGESPQPPSVPMPSWHSYPSIYNVGHRAVADIMKGAVNVEEKVDGSQFSFGVDLNGEIHLRSKGAIMLADAPEKMFSAAAATVRHLADRLNPGWTYRGEYLRVPKHNSLTYGRIPREHVILFDVNTSEETYLSYWDKAHEAERLGLECVPLIYSGIVSSMEQFKGFLDRESILGGQRVEGVVVKPANYELFGLDKKVLMAKFVSEAFKEVHAKEWKKSNPTAGDIVEHLAAELRTDARWSKAVQHMREAGILTDTPKDIGGLIKEIASDTHKECSEEIKEKLFKWAWPHIQRKIVSGAPEWYKEQLARASFGEDGGAA